MKTIYLLLLLFIVPSASAYCDVGDNLIEPRYYEGNLLIFNEGYVPYSVFSDGDYVGTINHNQGIYLNESCDYTMYAAYNELRDFENLDIIEKKFNAWWLIILVLIIATIVIVRIYKVIK